MPQWLAKVDHRIKWLHPERAFLGRHKFYHFRFWYREFLSEYVQSVLLDERSLSRPYLERKAVRALVEDHVAGRRNATLGINKLLTLELVHRHLIDSSRGSDEAMEAVGTSSLQPQ